MKAAILTTAIMLLSGTTSLRAQTCDAPLDWHPWSSPPESSTFADTTCGHETSILAVCQDAFGAPGAAFVARITVTDDAPFTNIDANGGPGYTLAMYLIPVANGCGNFPCTTTGDATTDLLHLDIPAGTYYLIVTGADFDAPGACGDFQLATNGALPVAVQEFSVH